LLDSGEFEYGSMRTPDGRIRAVSARWDGSRVMVSLEEGERVLDLEFDEPT